MWEDGEGGKNSTQRLLRWMAQVISMSIWGLIDNAWVSTDQMIDLWAAILQEQIICSDCVQWYKYFSSVWQLLSGLHYAIHYVICLSNHICISSHTSTLICNLKILIKVQSLCKHNPNNSQPRIIGWIPIKTFKLTEHLKSVDQIGAFISFERHSKDSKSCPLKTSMNCDQQWII